MKRSAPPVSQTARLSRLKADRHSRTLGQEILAGTDHIMAARNVQHIITAWLRWHLADEEFRRTENFLRSGCTFCDLADVAYKTW